MLKIMDLPWVCQEKATWWEASVPWMDSAYAVRVTDRGQVRLRVGYSSGFVPFDGTVEQAQQRAQEHFNEIIRGFVRVEVSPEEVEAAAKELERIRCGPYEWTDEQFEIWWNKDPHFVEHTRRWADFEGTSKQRAIWEAQVIAGSLCTQPPQ